MTNIAPIQRHIATIRRQLDMPSNPARAASLMLADALRDPHLNREVMVMWIAALVTHDEAQRIAGLAWERERHER